MGNENLKETVPSHAIEAFCRAQYVERYLDKIIKKAALNEKSFVGVLYADTKEPAPVFVVKCAVVPYLSQMESRPRQISGYRTAYHPVHIDENADKVAEALDRESLLAVLRRIAEYTGTNAPQCLIPLCRFGRAKELEYTLSCIREWDTWYQYGSAGRSSMIVARGAALLHESREAMLYAEKCKLLSIYAQMRGLTADVLRDTKLSDFGLDENGKKLLDLGSTVIEAAVGQDLQISLYDTKNQKTVKSLPKRGADPEKYETAAAAFTDLKKNLKKVVKSRNDILFERFLDGKAQKATAWLASYTGNPALHRVAELLVWSQKDKTFILTPKGAVDSGGYPYQVNETDAICVAHPMEMSLTEVQAWQDYFARNGLKQPFEQIWEPVVDVTAFRETRYKSIMIPFYRFKNREKHGIYVEDYDYHNAINIRLAGCDTQVSRIDWTRHQLDVNDRFEITSISFRKMNRMVNHILAYLDRVTVYGRIADDDAAAVAILLPNFTLAQIADFIQLASENKCPNVTALLLDYRQKHFSNFNPMAEFTLD